MRELLRSAWARTCACFLAALYIRAVRATSSWRVINGAAAEAAWATGRPFILAFWHGRLLMMPYAWRRGIAMNMLISTHRDGELIAGTIRYFRLGSVRGSSRRDGAAALRAMLKALRAGECVGITPDGPRGPRMHASEGVVGIAKLAGVPVIPAAFATSRRVLLRTWDRFALALPFSRGVFVWGEPIRVDRHEDTGAALGRIEAALNAVTAEADRMVGHAPVEPAPAQA
jgi:lysophospholipid acyltransferase (LPLAT)-like uncharacterized protein